LKSPRDPGYEHYYNSYYERQRLARKEYAVQSDRKSKVSNYSQMDEEELGLGDPRNLAAFDLPLSSQMSQGNKKSRQPRQGTL